MRGAELCGLWPPAPRAAAREMCEEFAPRNGATRAREERGANRARKPKTKGLRGVEREPCQPQGSLCLPEAPSPCRPGGPIPLPEGPSHFRLTPTKNAGRPPGVFPYPINPVILTIPADSGRFPRILPGTLSAVEALLRCPLRGWLPRSAEAPDRAGTSAGGTNRCGRSDRN